MFTMPMFMFTMPMFMIGPPQRGRVIAAQPFLRSDDACEEASSSPRRGPVVLSSSYRFLAAEAVLARARRLLTARHTPLL